MIRKLLGLAAAVLLPSLLAAQTPTIPNDHASAQGKDMATAHSQSAQHRATHRRGEVVHPEDVDHDRDDHSRPEDADHDRDDRGRNPKAAMPATRAPAAGFASPNLAADVLGSFASLPGGVWSGQGRGDLWVASAPVFHGWRLGLEGVLAGTSRTDGAWTAAGQGIGELLWSQPQWGVGLGAGPSGGWIANDTPVAALRVRARAWRRSGGPDLQLSIEPTHFPGAWFTDASVGAALERGPAIAAICSTVRLSGE